MNSLVIVLFLSGMVAMILLRTLHKDIARYNQMDSSVSKMQLLNLGNGFIQAEGSFKTDKREILNMNTEGGVAVSFSTREGTQLPLFERKPWVLGFLYKTEQLILI